MSSNPLNEPLSTIPGIGKATAESLEKSEIYTIFDLILRIPKKIIEEHSASKFNELIPNNYYCVSGTVSEKKVTGFGTKRRLVAVLNDKCGFLHIVFFGNAITFASKLLNSGEKVTVVGEVKHFLGRMQMVHPKIIGGQNQGNNEILHQSQYSQIAGINSNRIKIIMEKVLKYINNAPIKEYLPNEFLVENNLSPLKRAIIGAHKKDTAKEQIEKNESNLRRMAFEELMGFYLSLFKKRKDKILNEGMVFKKTNLDALTKNFLPFELTKAQKRVSHEILDDLSKKQCMSRLLQGDVGSGKTAVCALIAKHVTNFNTQVAVMAPTEILAQQLYKNFLSFFKSDYEITLLTASTKQKARKEIVEKIKSNDIKIVIGTHALLSDDVEFNSLSLLVIDEQHRFGVEQRAKLLHHCQKKQGFMPHLLVMSATPIPRSLALTAYGDLDLSIIDERPKGRLPIHTQILGGDINSSLLKLCSRIIESKQKAFIVFPLVEESEKLDLMDATTAFTNINAHFLNNRCALIHGKMSIKEKEEAMENFKDGSVSLLVSTTVVEVGVDIPDATVMVIAHAERFGLAQLHQLRGRVGRKDKKSYCFLLTTIKNKHSTAFSRLHAMCESNDGFKLSSIDLDIRGPGEVLGKKQSGLMNFQIFNHKDFADIIYPCKQMAIKLGTQAHPDYIHLYRKTTSRESAA